MQLLLILKGCCMQPVKFCGKRQRRERELPFQMKLIFETAPAFEVRGLGVAQGHTMRTLTDARAWTEKEWQRVVLDYALAGANTFSIGHKFHFIKSYGLKTLTSLSPNMGSGPPKWQAKEAIGRKGFLCLSIPEARAAILKRNKERWRNAVIDEIASPAARRG